MKNNFSMILNVVLLIAVGILFYLHFSSKREIADVKNSVKVDSIPPKLTFDVPKNLAGARVLYVNIDSIDAKYEAFSDLSKEANSKYEYQVKQYQQKAVDLQQRYDNLQQKVQMGTISADDAAKEETAINAGMDELKKLENYISTMQTAALQKNAVITEQIQVYFKEYSREKGIDYILGYGSTSNVLYANDSLDVTADVLAALNANYRLNKAQQPKKK